MGLSERYSLIFSAVNPVPEQPPLGSGRLANGAVVSMQTAKSFEELLSRSHYGCEPAR